MMYLFQSNFDISLDDSGIYHMIVTETSCFKSMSLFQWIEAMLVAHLVISNI